MYNKTDQLQTERRKDKNRHLRAESQPALNRLKEIYQKLAFCQHYTKRSVTLLTQSSEEIENALIKAGLSQKRIEDIFKDSIVINK